MDSVQKAARALVRAKRKEKAARHDLLRELYGAAVLAHLFQSLKTSLTGQWRMAEYVDINDLKSLQIEYSHLGYRHIDTLGKTDIAVAEQKHFAKVLRASRVANLSC